MYKKAQARSSGFVRPPLLPAGSGVRAGSRVAMLSPPAESEKQRHHCQQPVPGLNPPTPEEGLAAEASVSSAGPEPSPRATRSTEPVASMKPLTLRDDPAGQSPTNKREGSGSASPGPKRSRPGPHSVNDDAPSDAGFHGRAPPPTDPSSNPIAPGPAPVPPSGLRPSSPGSRPPPPSDPTPTRPDPLSPPPKSPDTRRPLRLAPFRRTSWWLR